MPTMIPQVCSSQQHGEAQGVQAHLRLGDTRIDNPQGHTVLDWARAGPKAPTHS